MEKKWKLTASNKQNRTGFQVGAQLSSVCAVKIGNVTEILGRVGVDYKPVSGQRGMDSGERRKSTL